MSLNPGSAFGVSRRDETSFGLPLPPFAVLIIGFNALLVIPGLIILSFADSGFADTGMLNGFAVPVGLFILPFAICWAFVTGRGISRELTVLQAALLGWAFWPALWVAIPVLLAGWACCAPGPRQWYRALAKGSVSRADLRTLPSWPDGTLAVMDVLAKVLHGAVWLLALYFLAIPVLHMSGLVFRLN